MSTPTFEDDFWPLYPVQKDRLRAERAWKRLTAEQRIQALEALPAYIADCQRTGTYYQYAQGWLNGHRFMDYVTEDTAAAQNPAGTGGPQSPREESPRPEQMLLF